MIVHAIEVMDGLDAKFGVNRFQYLFLFDHSANHEAFATDALRATNVNKGWGGKQAKMRPTVFRRHSAIDKVKIKGRPRLQVNSAIEVKGWWSTRRKKWWKGVIVSLNSIGKFLVALALLTHTHTHGRHSTHARAHPHTHTHTDTGWNKDTYVVDFEEEIDQPMCFPSDSPPPVSKYGGRGAGNILLLQDNIYRACAVPLVVSIS